MICSGMKLDLNFSSLRSWESARLLCECRNVKIVRKKNNCTVRPLLLRNLKFKFAIRDPRLKYYPRHQRFEPPGCKLILARRILE